VEEEEGSMTRSVSFRVRSHVALLGVMLLLGVTGAILADEDQDSPAPGDLDPSFGKGGVVTSNPSDHGDGAMAVSLDSS
jgi:hypothetical protein